MRVVGIGIALAYLIATTAMAAEYKVGPLLIGDPWSPPDPLRVCLLGRNKANAYIEPTRMTQATFCRLCYLVI
jgi:hypothetical protein